MNSISLPKLLIAILLFIAANRLFQFINPQIFDKKGRVTHIIDSHLTPEKGVDTSFNAYGQRFFDAAYVKEAAQVYKPGVYMRSFFMLDLIFPFIYGFLFLSLFGAWKNTPFYKTVRWLVFACIVFDLLENGSFAYFLYHQGSAVNRFTAVCTTVKSIFFILCALLALGGVVVWGVRKWGRKGRV
jgi:hypothetical protein